MGYPISCWTPSRLEPVAEKIRLVTRSYNIRNTVNTDFVTKRVGQSSTTEYVTYKDASNIHGDVSNEIKVYTKTLSMHFE